MVVAVVEVTVTPGWPGSGTEESADIHHSSHVWYDSSWSNSLNGMLFWLSTRLLGRCLDVPIMHIIIIIIRCFTVQELEKEEVTR